MVKKKQIANEKDIKKFAKDVGAKPPSRADDPQGHAYKFAKAIEQSETTEKLLRSFQKSLKGKLETLEKMKSYFRKEEAYLQRRIERNKQARQELQKMSRIRAEK